jgi:hypothetical protein
MICPVEIASEVSDWQAGGSESMECMFSYTHAAIERTMKVQDFPVAPRPAKAGKALLPVGTLEVFSDIVPLARSGPISGPARNWSGGSRSLCPLAKRKLFRQKFYIRGVQ